LSWFERGERGDTAAGADQMNIEVKGVMCQKRKAGQ